MGFQTRVPGQNIETPELNPISPTAYEFMKFTDVPISEYTGTADISIPIYTIEADGISIPISLRYHSLGIKVQEEASWVGLGWNLSADGSIVQIVNDKDDFGQYASDYDRNPIIFNNQSIPDGAFDCMPFYNGFFYAHNTEVNGSKFYDVNEEPLNFPFQYFDEFASSSSDKEPDSFKFNFLKWNGEFVYDNQSNNFISLTDENIRIQANQLGSNNRPGSFEIIVSEGHRFLFTKYSETEIEYFGMSRPHSSIPDFNQPSFNDKTGEKTSREYKLTQIITNEGDVISFDYHRANGIVNYPNISFNTTYHETLSEIGYAIDGNSGSITANYSNAKQKKEYEFPYIDQILTRTKTSQDIHYLKEISADKVKVNFISSTDRVDLNGARKLNTIEIRTSENVLIKRFRLEYDYFIGHTSGDNIDNFLSESFVTKTPAELTHRLRLLSFGEEWYPPYTFEYFAELLPKKTSLATDYWGYYNGQLDNTSLYPNFWNFGLDYDIGKNNFKASNVNYCKAGTLNRINYPTGGFTIYHYQSNTYGNYFAPSNNLDEFNRSETHRLTDDNTPYQSGDDPLYVNIANPDGLNLSGTVNLTIDGTSCDVADGGTTYDQNKFYNTYALITVWNEEALNVWQNSPSSIGSIFTNPEEYLINEIKHDLVVLNQQNSSIEYLLSLNEEINTYFEPGTLIRVSVSLSDVCEPMGSGSFQNRGYASMNFNVRHRPPQPEQQTSYGAGLRIHYTESDPSEDGIPKLKVLYEYAGGKLMSPPTFIDEYKMYGKWNVKQSFAPVGAASRCEYYEWLGLRTALSNNSFLPYSTSAQGNYVGYDAVTKKELDGFSGQPTNGKTVTKFINNADEGYPSYVGKGQGIYTSFPLEKKYPENGNVINSINYDNNGTKISGTFNTYKSIVEPSCLYTLKFIKTESLSTGCEGLTFSKYDIGYHPIKTREAVQTSSSHVQYFGADSLVTSRVFEFNDYNELSKETFTDSEGRTHETRYYYPYDDLQYNSMVQSNYISPVIRKEVDIEGSRALTEKYHYVPGNIVGSYLQRNATTSWAEGTEFINFQLQRDPEDKIGQISDRYGVTKSYLWGYGGEYVVAEVVGAGYSECEAIVNMNILHNPASDEALRAELDKLRTGLPHTLITTYTHIPLVGVTSITDPNRLTTYYYYNHDDRLEYIKDSDGHVLERYEYNFKN